MGNDRFSHDFFSRDSLDVNHGRNKKNFEYKKIQEKEGTKKRRFGTRNARAAHQQRKKKKTGNEQNRKKLN